MNPKEFFSSEEQKEIMRAIREAEHSTSGEIRVHLENKCRSQVLDRAAHVFKQLNMHRTKLRNGVLFYISLDDHKFAIIGDAGINQKVPPDFWDLIKSEMETKFSSGKFAEGLSEAIRKAGEKLKEHFPYQQDDVNELSDEISFEK